VRSIVNALLFGKYLLFFGVVVVSLRLERTLCYFDNNLSVVAVLDFTCVLETENCYLIIIY
jgi:hypothetical protein